MNKPFTQDWWSKYDAEVKDKILKNTKSGSISFLESQDNYASRKEIYHAHWEDYLSSSPYFKNWREKINSFKTEKEIHFYTDRLGTFIDFVRENTRKEVNYIDENSPKQWDPETTPKLIEQELKRLENISEEDFNKTDKWRKNGPVFKELSIEEMKNDPWFSEQLGLDSENKKDEERKEKENPPILSSEKEEKPVKKGSDSNANNIDYKSWIKDQLISEIKSLKAENEELKNNQTLSSSEKQERLQKNQQKISELSSYYNNCLQSSSQPNNSNNKFPTSWVVSGAVLLGVGGLFAALHWRKFIKK